MEQDRGALTRMDNEFENSKKEQIMSFLRDQSKFNRCLNLTLKDDEDNDDDNDSYLLSSISDSRLRLPLNSVSRPKTASISRKSQADIVDEHEMQACINSKTSQRPRSSYTCCKAQLLKMENEFDSRGFRKRANTTEMSRIEEIDVISNASTRSVTPDLDDINDSVFISPLSPQEKNLNQQTSPTQYRPDYTRRRVKSYTGEASTTKMKPRDLKLLKEKFIGNNNIILPSQIKNTSINEIVAEDDNTNTDSMSTSMVRSKSTYETVSSGLQSPKHIPHGVVAIDPLPIATQKIGVQGIAMVECDASLYRKIRNKSTTNVRQTEPGTFPYKIYHLPPLERTPSGTAINNGDVTPPTQVTDLILS